MKLKTLEKTLLILAILPAAVSCDYHGESGGFSSGVSFMYPAFNTSYSINVYDGDKTLEQPIKDALDNYYGLCDKFYPYIENNVHTINENKNKEIKINQDLFDVLKESLRLEKLSNGYFNPLMGKLSDLWKNSVKNDKKVPQNADILRYLEEVKSSKLILDEENLTAKITGNAELDLGGIAKGYSLDVVNKILKEKQFSSYVINGGNSSISIGKHPENKDFRVRINGVEKSENNQKLQGVFYTKETMISTSSLFAQKMEVDGEIYSHIINPFTGSAKTNFDLVLIQGGELTGVMQDAFSTAFSHMNLDDILSLKNQYNFDLLLYKDNKVVYEDGIGLTYEKV